jgi:hypothetical protein
MNIRFKELAQEADLIASESNGFDRTSLSTAEIRFAQLIVDQCFAICISNALDGFDSNVSDACSKSAFEIKQHFSE